MPGSARQAAFPTSAHEFTQEHTHSVRAQRNLVSYSEAAAGVTPQRPHSRRSYRAPPRCRPGRSLRRADSRTQRRQPCEPDAQGTERGCPAAEILLLGGGRSAESAAAAVRC